MNHKHKGKIIVLNSRRKSLKTILEPLKNFVFTILKYYSNSRLSNKKNEKYFKGIRGITDTMTCKG
jgi:hypothetical protein